MTVPSLVIQHIPVCEIFSLLTRVKRTKKVLFADSELMTANISF